MHRHIDALTAVRCLAKMVGYALQADNVELAQRHLEHLDRIVLDDAKDTQRRRLLAPAEGTFVSPSSLALSLLA